MTPTEAAGGQAASGLRVAFVAGVATGGTARHVATLAAGCRDAGLDVTVLAPAATLDVLRSNANLAGFGFSDSAKNASPAGAGSAGGSEGDPAGSSDRSRPAGGAGPAEAGAGSAGGNEGDPAGGRAAEAGAAHELRGIELLPVDIGDRPRPVRDAAAIARLRAEFAGREPDVVHAHGVRAGACAALALGIPAVRRPEARPSAALRAPAGSAGSGARRRRPAFVVTVHNAPPPGRAACLAYAVLERICARRADLVLGASADLVTRMRGLGADAEQFDVPAAPLASPAEAAVAAARADIGANGRPVVLAVGRLAAQKGFDVLVAAAAQWGDRDPQPRTAIAGDGPLADELRTQARQSGADVVLLGARDDVAALLAVADVVVVPSRWEARALILQEALRAGRAVVASRVGGTPELTGEDGALLVPPAEPALLAAAVAAVLDDPRLAASLSAAARRRSATFPAVEAAVAAALSIYRRILADHS